MCTKSSTSVDQYKFDQTIVPADKTMGHDTQNKKSNVRMKKSILVTKRDSFKRGSSKVTIHWQESKDDPLLSREQKRSGESGQRIVLNRGLRWKSIHEVLNRLKEDEEINPIELEETNTADPEAMDFLAREMGVRKLRVLNVQLSVDQEAKLRLMKQKVQRDNKRYLMKHPEDLRSYISATFSGFLDVLDTMLLLIYRMLFKIKPGGRDIYTGPLDFLRPELKSSDPKVYVANYVHHLNLHRDELVLSEVDVPFDQPADRVKDEEKWRITQFARVLVEKCVVIASQGEAFVNVSGILDSMLKDVSPSFESITSAREAVADILTSVLASVDDAKRQETKQIAEDILNAILSRLRPKLQKLSSIDVRDSVERAVESFMRALIGRVGKQIRLKGNNLISGSSYESEDILDEFFALLPSKSILRRKRVDSDEIVDEDVMEESAARTKFASRVKFGSVDELNPDLTD